MKSKFIFNKKKDALKLAGGTGLVVASTLYKDAISKKIEGMTGNKEIGELAPIMLSAIGIFMVRSGASKLGFARGAEFILTPPKNGVVSWAITRKNGKTWTIVDEAAAKAMEAQMKAFNTYCHK